MLKFSTHFFSYSFQICVASLVIVSVGCSDERSSPSQTLTQSFQYPHPEKWKALHSGYLSAQSPTPEKEADLRKCLSCHATSSKALTLGPSISCGGSCHSSSAVKFDVKSPSLTLVGNECSNCHSSMSNHFLNLHYPSAAGMCTLCHTATASHLSGADTHAVQTTASDELCYRCHTKKDQQSFHHAAVETGKSCMNCHNPHGSNEVSLLKAKAPTLCMQCHSATPHTGKSVHKPMQNENSCLLCHNAHGGEVARLLKVETPKLCIACHEKTSLDGKSVHVAIRAGQNCLNCHKPHATNHEKLLPLSTNDLCLSCHNREMISTSPGGRVIGDIAKKFKGASVHAPMGSENCTETCHRAHASESDPLLQANYPRTHFNAYVEDPNTYDLCFKCHELKLMKEKIADDDTYFRSDVQDADGIHRTNLHWVHTVKSGGWSCNTCHDPHGSTQNFNIRTSLRMGADTISIAFTPSEKGGSCASSCHSARTYLRISDQKAATSK